MTLKVTDNQSAILATAGLFVFFVTNLRGYKGLVAEDFGRTDRQTEAGQTMRLYTGVLACMRDKSAEQ